MSMYHIKRHDHEWMATGLACLLAILIIVGIVWFRAANEAAVFNKLTGGNATTWDAVWADLRVIGEVKQP